MNKLPASLQLCTKATTSSTYLDFPFASESLCRFTPSERPREADLPSETSTWLAFKPATSCSFDLVVLSSETPSKASFKPSHENACEPSVNDWLPLGNFENVRLSTSFGEFPLCFCRFSLFLLSSDELEASTVVTPSPSPRPLDFDSLPTLAAGYSPVVTHFELISMSRRHSSVSGYGL